MSLLRRRWLQMLLSGIVLLFLVERTLLATSNPNYAPSVILLGAFLVPVTFVTYLYERRPSWDVNLPALAYRWLVLPVTVWAAVPSPQSTTCLIAAGAEVSLS